MAKISANTVAMPMMLVVACITMLVPTGLAQFTPQMSGLLPPVQGAGKCWSSLTNIPSCLWEIYGSLSSGQVSKIGPACCNAINQVTDDCWPKMLPFHPFFPPLLKKFCSAPSPDDQPIAKTKLFVPTVNVTEITECWSSITSTEGCVAEVFKSLTSGQITGNIGPACCKVVTDINDKCWPMIFPFNPFIPPMLKSTCAQVNVVGATPTPKTI